MCYTNALTYLFTFDYIELDAYYCMLFGSRVKVRVRIRFCVWSISIVMRTHLYYFPLSLSLSRAKMNDADNGY